MRVLVACEFSGRVRDAFRARGHDAWSCDLLECEPSRWGTDHHLKGDLLNWIGAPGWMKACSWDLMIAFPPCTYLASSGARWWKDRKYLQREALNFVRMLMRQDVGRIAIENPIGRISTAIRKPDQIIQPWQFGHGETKATCLWLKNLPLLVPTNIVEGRESRIHKMSPSPTRSRDRSRTYQGIADAMADQWGQLGAKEEEN